MLRNRCYKMRTRNRETENIEDTEILAPHIGLPREERVALERAFVSLPREDRELITLKYLDGLSYQELAEHLQIPKGTVMSRLFHVRKQLQRKLTGQFH
ncbi:MAG: RNA polymerase sigma factor [Pyrinomonadaceae bacterium]